jgi:hypothetical protein
LPYQQACMPTWSASRTVRFIALSGPSLQRLEVLLLDLCFNWLSSPMSGIAVSMRSSANHLDQSSLQNTCHWLVPFCTYATADNGVLFFAFEATISDCEPPTQLPSAVKRSKRISPEWCWKYMTSEPRGASARFDANDWEARAIPDPLKAPRVV